MIVVTVGYSGTGSSAITHLLSEYDNFTTGGLGKYEHLPLYTPNGLFDLEDRLLLGNHLHASDAALSAFYNEMLRLNNYDFGWFGGYRKRFGNRFMEIVDEFMNDIIEYDIEGFWSYDFRGYKKDIRKFGKRIIKRILGYPIIAHDYSFKKNSDNKILYSFINEEKFYNAAKKFVKSYCNMINKDSNKILVCDQLLLPQNLYRVPRYFDENDIKIIVVNRDPRDMYVLSKYIWPRMGSKKIFPDTPEEFINFYKGLYNIEKRITDSRIKRIAFEDLVYSYDNMVEEIEQFLCISSNLHTQKFKIFKPEISIKNTQNFLIKEEWENEVRIISEEMKDMLYDFPYRFIPKINETTDP